MCKRVFYPFLSDKQDVYQTALYYNQYMLHVIIFLKLFKFPLYTYYIYTIFYVKLSSRQLSGDIIRD